MACKRASLALWQSGTRKQFDRFRKGLLMMAQQLCCFLANIPIELLLVVFTGLGSNVVRVETPSQEVHAYTQANSRGVGE